MLSVTLFLQKFGDTVINALNQAALDQWTAVINLEMHIVQVNLKIPNHSSQGPELRRVLTSEHTNDTGKQRSNQDCTCNTVEPVRWNTSPIGTLV